MKLFREIRCLEKRVSREAVERGVLGDLPQLLAQRADGGDVVCFRGAGFVEDSFGTIRVHS